MAFRIFVCGFANEGTVYAFATRDAATRSYVGIADAAEFDADYAGAEAGR
jgi:hypothetical protein